MRIKPLGLQDGYLMSQPEVAIELGIVQQTVSKAEKSMIIKLKAGLSKHGIDEATFAQFMKYSGL
jgi:hypothetical protein